MSKMPVNHCSLDLNPTGFWVWLIAECVVCGHRHLHGGGRVEGDPRRMLGHRSGACVGSGYLIEAARPVALPEFIRETRARFLRGRAIPEVSPDQLGLVGLGLGRWAIASSFARPCDRVSCCPGECHGASRVA